MRSKRTSVWRQLLLPAAGLLLFLAACTSEGPTVTTPLGDVPVLNLEDEFNNLGACMAADVMAAPGGFDSPSLASGHCSSQDIKIATADILEYSINGGTSYNTYVPGTQVTCNENQPLKVRINAHVKETATSERTDIGIWVGTNGGNGRTGQCGHYNLVNGAALVGGGVVPNIDGDHCGDMTNAGEVIVELGIIDAVCQSSGTSNLVHIGSCIGWTQPGGDQQCELPESSPGVPGLFDRFRWATIPGTSSKCNCSGFDIPIVVNRSAKLEIVKACTPSTDPGKFDLFIDDIIKADDASCGGTTGEQTVSAGTSLVPGAVHTFGEAAGANTSLSNYTSSFACANDGGGPRTTNGTSITLQPNDDVICTYTNVRNTGTVEVRKSWSGTGGQTTLKVGTTAGGSEVKSQLTGAAGAAPLTTAAQTVNTGTYYVSEAGGLDDYASSLACTDNAQSITPGANNSVSVATGHAIICTFTNTRNTGTIELKKAWVGTPSQTTLRIGTSVGGSQVGSQLTGLAGAAPLTTGAKTVETGTFYVSENGGLAGYGSSLACTDGTNAVSVGTDNAVSVAKDKNVVCTFTNSRETGTIELRKAWIGTAGQTTLRIGSSANGSDVESTVTGAVGAAPLTTGTKTVNSGTYHVSEINGLADYSSSLDCTDNGISVGSGSSVNVAKDHAVICTFTNTRNQGTIELRKVWVGGGGQTTLRIGTAANGTQEASQQTGANGAAPLTTDAQPVNTGTYYVSEDGGLTDYLSQLACTDGTNPVSVGTNNSVIVTTGKNVVCTFTNTKQPKVKLVKDLVPNLDAGRFDLRIGTTTFNNSSNGYGDLEHTGFQTVAIGDVNISELAHGTTTVLSEYTSTLSCAGKTVSSNTGTSGTINVSAGDEVTCTFVNTHAPKLSITKTANDATVSPGDTARFTIVVSAASDGGPALDVKLDDILPPGLHIPGTDPAQLGWRFVPPHAGLPDGGDPDDHCDIDLYPVPAPVLPAVQERRFLDCDIGTLNPGDSYTVVVEAKVPANFLLKPPTDPGDPIEIDGNLIDDAGGGIDWGTTGLIDCSSTPKGCSIDQATGATDNSFGNGTKEDDAVPSIVSGSIPNNKSDLLRFYLATQRIVTTDHLYLAWERVQEPSGTTNMDFELNQASQGLSTNGTTPIRLANDVLIKYDLAQGGVNAILGFHKWVTSGACSANGAKPPCWGPVTDLTGVGVHAGIINQSPVQDPIAPNQPRNLSIRTFGEARINLQASQIFQSGICTVFGSAYLKSRSSDSFTAAIKDFIAPIPINVSNCELKTLENIARAMASNFASGAWISSTKASIVVSDGTTGTSLGSLRRE